jgi:class 3 adenylate cyclase
LKKQQTLFSKHNIEKIKTIGDSYMCAGGLPVPNKTNATDVINAALEIRDFMLKRNSETDHPKFEIRIGVHTGPVVAGIVGIKKFAYDIWGDTVNIASCMESSGETGKVNISSSTFELVKDKFNCMHRGEIQAKHKGEMEKILPTAQLTSPPHHLSRPVPRLRRNINHIHPRGEVAGRDLYIAPAEFT